MIIKFCKQDVGVIKKKQYKHSFNLCFFSCPVVSTLPNTFGYFDSFLKYLVTSYSPNRIKFAKEFVMISPRRTVTFQTDKKKWRLRNKTTTSKIQTNPRSNQEITTSFLYDLELQVFQKSNSFPHRVVLKFSIYTLRNYKVKKYLDLTIKPYFSVYQTVITTKAV